VISVLDQSKTDELHFQLEVIALQAVAVFSKFGLRMILKWTYLISSEVRKYKLRIQANTKTCSRRADQWRSDQQWSASSHCLRRDQFTLSRVSSNNLLREIYYLYYCRIMYNFRV